MLGEAIVVAVLHAGAMISPGPDLAILMSNAFTGQRRKVVSVAVGYALASATHVVLVTTGLWLAVVDNESLSRYVAFFGGGFAILVGALFLAQRDSFDYTQAESRALGNTWSFLQAVIANLTNIRAIVYFIAVFSQLVDEDTGNGEKVFWVAFIFVWSFLGALAIGIGLQRVGAFATSERTQRLLRYGVGGSLIALGVVLVVTNL